MLSVPTTTKLYSSFSTSNRKKKTDHNTTDLPKKLSLQLYGIKKKIRYSIVNK